MTFREALRLSREPPARERTAWTGAGKPLFDRIVALLFLVILSPLLAVVAVLAYHGRPPMRKPKT